MRALKRIFPVLLIALSVAVTGCGGNDKGKPIPAATATALDNELTGVQNRLDNGSAGACKDILEGSRGPNRDRVNQLIDSMPDDVDSDVRSALEDSFNKLWDLVQQECDDRQAKEDQAKQQQEQQKQETTTTETTPTETTPTETTPTETTPTDTAPLPNDGNGDSGGGVPGNNGNGLGSGGGAGPGGTG